MSDLHKGVSHPGQHEIYWPRRRHPPKLYFLCLYLLKRSLESRSRFVLLSDIHCRTDYS